MTMITSSRLLFQKKKYVGILTGSFKTGKLTPVKVTRHTMPQKGREHFNLTDSFLWRKSAEVL